MTSPEANLEHRSTPSRSIPDALKVLYASLSPARRRAVLPLLALMLAGAVAELFTIGALLPFLSVLASPDGSPLVTAIRPGLDLVGARTPSQILWAVTGLFAFAVLAASLMRLTLLWAYQRFVYGVAYELAVNIYGGTLTQPYIYHTRSNTSEIIASLTKIEMVTNQVLMPAISALVALVISVFLIGGLVAMDPWAALVAGGGFVVLYVATSFLTRRGLDHAAGAVAAAQDQRVRIMQEGLGGIRDVLIDRSHPVFVGAYEQCEARFRDARSRIALYANAPRFIVEGAGMVLIALVAVTVVGRPGGLGGALPILGALALGGQKLLPMVQQIYLGWAQTVGNRQNLFDVVDLLRATSAGADVASTEVSPLPFRSVISLDGVGYAYETGRKAALSGVTLEIPRGARVGISGKTGSGKSTLMDLVLGLLEPTEGRILVDGVALTDANRAAWQKNIAHVPQAIFLSDASVAENIAFGVSKDRIDLTRVRHAAEQAELSDVIAALPKGYDTRVGERGIQLSGGQRQRIGIARALYKQARVLVFDEATSALDTETEVAVMSAIERLDRDLTILIIAHRLSTLENCDVVLRLEGGRVVQQASTHV
ncbi:MAG TPA: ABC transporter ATP-binding protein [Brevundimonas sp.]|uniref:ABC transporter ATP-binding protein n=1 Tax=Brevundimonas sp. TaxID=1871086 RepID=UPI002DF364F2|nr:ABC transporter ATP-binding protein [Brevundimonas sp.]